MWFRARKARKGENPNKRIMKIPNCTSNFPLWWLPLLRCLRCAAYLRCSLSPCENFKGCFACKQAEKMREMGKTFAKQINIKTILFSIFLGVKERAKFIYRELETNICFGEWFLKIYFFQVLRAKKEEMFSAKRSHDHTWSEEVVFFVMEIATHIHTHFCIHAAVTLNILCTIIVCTMLNIKHNIITTMRRRMHAYECRSMHDIHIHFMFTLLPYACAARLIFCVSVSSFLSLLHAILCNFYYENFPSNEITWEIRKLIFHMEFVLKMLLILMIVLCSYIHAYTHICVSLFSKCTIEIDDCI